MNDEWLKMRRAEGLHDGAAAGSPEELSAYTGASAPQLCDLSAYRIYELTGTDTSAFLQGQFCNDLAQVTTTQAQITGYCTPKGRLLALPLIVGFPGGFRLVLPDDVADAFIKRLSMFVMRSDVQIKPLEDWVMLGMTADAQGSLGAASTVTGPLPVGRLAASSSETQQLVCWHADFTGEVPRQRYLRLAPLSEQMSLWRDFPPAHRSGRAPWRLGDISAGVPSITQGVVEAFVPQMINLQLIDALSFTKGCYPGQEIVARMQYLGKLKRHMRLFKLTTADSLSGSMERLAPGQALTAGTDENAGIIVDAMPVDTHHALVLAVTKVSVGDEAFTVNGLPLAAHDLPYQLPSLEVA